MAETSTEKKLNNVKVGKTKIPDHGTPVAGIPVSTDADSPAPPGHPPKRDTPDYYSAYQKHLFRNAGTVEHPAWSDHIAGRTGIRLISRGIVGAAAFALGGRYARMQLMNYHPETYRFSSAKPLQAIAYAVDTVFGRPIAASAHKIAEWQGLEGQALENATWNAVNFRPKSYHHTYSGMLTPNGKPMNGESLGRAFVNVSFDFAMASIGDASTRNFFQMIDPNIRKSWMVNDRGEKAKEGEKSHFDTKKFLQSQLKATWRVLSKNQGEDWAVALPYLYQMKLQRGLIGDVFGREAQGVKLVLDNTLNGAAFKVNKAGTIIGDYQMLGALDLHLRFVGYNVYTLMYREGYDRLANAFDRWKDNGFKVEMPHLPEHPLDALGNGIKDAARYVIKSTIKANLYMNPAVIPFWLIRTPSTKWRGAMINVDAPPNENAVAADISFDERAERRLKIERTVFNNESITREEMLSRMRMPILENEKMVRNHNPLVYRRQPTHRDKEFMYLENEKVPNPFHNKSAHTWDVYKTYETRTTYGKISKLFSQAVHPFGQATTWVGDRLVALAEKMPEGAIKDFLSINESESLLHGNKVISDNAGLHTFTRSFVDASFAYTPYMFAKAELATLVDDQTGDGKPGKMDKAIYALMDKTVALDWKGIKQSAHDIWKLGTHMERDIGEKPLPAMPELSIPEKTVQAEGRTVEIGTSKSVGSHAIPLAARA